MKSTVLLLCGLFMHVATWAQRDFEEGDKPSFKDRLYFGGGLGFNSGTSGTAGRYTYIGLYPVIGYMATPKMSVGTSITYQHYSYADLGTSFEQYGFAPFIRYNLNQIFLYSEYMILNSPTYDPNSPRKIYNRWLNGVGYRMPIGQRSAVNVMGLYDVLYNDTERIFSSPWVVRVFFSI
ncbi:MAG: hypothetical protein U0289_14605 [Cyclobacteriaceae bacterium]|jgi:hypothetical protein|nr:hypothetical protein [Cyclobacteriaceae bacterium]HQQ82284.1 hypothetical protein [Cyclobacteriaceae bacterium]